ncbi:uncharacterized protein [Haliotis cracherodii]|uniref:uncharacterized protein n=1 Tax=Haliotis cracherodii TaxID=6455 RepID=UPI0039E9E1A0
MQALNAAVLVLVLIFVVSPSCGQVWGNWGQWTETAGECNALCGEGTQTIRKRRPCVGGLFCKPISGGSATTIEECNNKSCAGVCRQGCISDIPNPKSNTSYYHCENNAALLVQCPTATVWSHCSSSCR